MKKLISGAILAVSLVATTTPSFAHHSFAAEYDASKPITLQGKLTKLSWVNPHGWRYVDVVDPEHEPCEPVVGSTPHSRGAAQVRDRGSTIDRGQISSPPAEATFPDLANLLDQSHGADGLHRLLCGADSDLPGSVCVCGVVKCSASCLALSSDRTPQPGLDDAADAGSVSMGPTVPISSARPRCDLRR